MEVTCEILTIEWHNRQVYQIRVACKTGNNRPIRYDVKKNSIIGIDTLEPMVQLPHIGVAFEAFIHAETIKPPTLIQRTIP